MDVVLFLKLSIDGNIFYNPFNEYYVKNVNK